MSEEYTEEKHVTLRRLGPARRLQEALLLIVTLFALWLMAALLSFDPADPSWSQTAWHEPIHNLAGIPGAWLADTLLFAFGIMAYPIPLLIIAGCWFAWRHHSHHGHEIDYFAVALRLIGTLALVITSCGLAAMNADDIWYFASGGVIGSLLATALAPWLNISESTIALLCLWAAGFTLFTGWSWITVAEKIGALIMGILTLTSNRARGVSHYHEQTQYDEPDRRISQPTATASANNEHTGMTALPATEQPAPMLRGALLRQQKSAQNALSASSHNIDDVLFSAHSITDMVPEATPKTMPTAETAAPSLPQAEDCQPFITSNDLPDHNSVTPNPVIDDQLSQHTAQHTAEDGQSQPAASQPAPQQNGSASPISAQPMATTANPPVDDHASGVTDEDKAASPVSINPPIPADKDQADRDWADKDWADVDQPDNEQADNDNSSAIPANTPAAIQFTPAFTMEDSPPPVLKPAPESLIHPLLMHGGNDNPLPKPTTPLPLLDLLTPPPTETEPVDHFALEQMARLVEARLADFRIKADVVNYQPGPVITRFELNLAPGVKAARISNLARDLARSLSAVAVRVVEVIPGKPYVGLELPNKKRQTVYLREVLDCPQFRDSKSPLSVVLGKDISGDPVVADLAKMPHLLVAGTTGSGKSVGVNAMILSMLYKATPDEVRFIMIDPKMLELSVYEGIPHLLTEVVTDMKDAANALRWSVGEMERRYKLMSALGVRNLAGYNDKIRQAEQMGRPIPDPYWKPSDSMALSHPVLEKLPSIVVLVDEFADLMMTAGKKVEELIARLAQKARAAGIHLVLATQRPSVDVITGLIKANIPTRIAFTVSSKIDSRTILDQSGAESLLGMGDMLYAGPSSNAPVRIHGAFVRDQEVHAVVQDWKARGRPQYLNGITAENDGEGGASEAGSDEALDPLFDQAVAFVVEKRKASISGVQRQLRIGYNRAARIVEQMEMQGIVSEAGHNGNREVLAPPPFE